MDTDGFLESMPSADVWKMLWSQGDGSEGLDIEYESGLMDDLLMVLERESVEQECAGICDGCRKVCSLI